jgi:hypothetical protein
LIATPRRPEAAVGPCFLLAARMGRKKEWRSLLISALSIKEPRGVSQFAGAPLLLSRRRVCWSRLPPGQGAPGTAFTTPGRRGTRREGRWGTPTALSALSREYQVRGALLYPSTQRDMRGNPFRPASEKAISRGDRLCRGGASPPPRQGRMPVVSWVMMRVRIWENSELSVGFPFSWFL